MATQGKGANSQQIGERANNSTTPPTNTINIADVADGFDQLSIDSQKANYLAPDDIVKKYKELEVQHQRDKVYNGKVICTILDFTKTLKHPPQ